jgi:hypothetical protein
MRFQSFLKQFEITLVSSLADFYSQKSSEEVEEFVQTIHQVMSFKYTSGMADLLLLRALERIVNNESELVYSGEVRHKIFQFLRKEKVFDFQGIFSKESKFNQVLDCFKTSESSMPPLKFALLVLREMAIVSELKESDFNFNSPERSNESSVMTRRTGIEFIELFFDLLNHESGFHPLNNFEEQ